MMHPTQKTIDMLRRATERINKLTRTTRKQFEDEVFNPPLRAKVTKKRAVDKHTPGGQGHDQDSHGRRGRVGPRGDASDDDETTTVSLGGDNSIPEDLLDHLKDLRAKGHSYKSLVDEATENDRQGREWFENTYKGNQFDLRQDLEGVMEDDDEKVTKDVQKPTSQVTLPGADKTQYQKRGSVKPKGNKIRKHPGHPDQSVHGRRGVYARAAGAGAAGAVAGRALAPAVRGLAATAAAGRAVSALSRTVQRINPKGVKKFRRLKRRATRALRRHTAKLGRAIAPAAKAGLRLASRVKVPGAIGIGLMAAAAGIGLVAQRTRKMQKAGGPTPGDHVLVLTGDEAIVGVYAGNETVRVLTNDSYIDTKPPKNDVLLVERGDTVPDENSSSDEIATLADTLSREKQVMENLSEKVKNGKVSKRSKVDKHAMGQHDQKTHGNRATRAVRAVRAKARRIGRRVTSGIRQAGKTIEATTQTTRQVADDLDSVLQGLEAGTRIYDKVKSLKDSLLGESEKMMKAKMSDKELAESKRLAERLKGKKDIDNPHALARWQVQQKLTKLDELVGSMLKGPKKVRRYSPPKSLRSSPSFMITPGVFGGSTKPRTMPIVKPRKPSKPSIKLKPRLPRMTRKFADVQAAFEKGIAHSLRTLTNALDLIREQEADKKISEADEKKLQEIIAEIRSMVGYLEEVKEQGFFEKGEAHVPDSTTMYRPSFTTPAVADHLKRQGIKPNAKGRGESTARAPGY